ncbi:MAG TPA: histidine phosphatase family protein [Noviherbaspirillum sp.]
MRLHLIRHPRLLIAPGVCYGSSDVPVCPDDMESTLAALLPALPAGVPIFSSPLARCRELAARLAHALSSAPPIHDKRLVEMHFGDWEMRAWEAIRKEDIDAWVADLAFYRPGGGENGMQVAKRLNDFLEDAKSLRAEDIIVVTHAGVIRLLLEIAAGVDLLSAALSVARTPRKIDCGELIALDC